MAEEDVVEETEVETEVVVPDEPQGELNLESSSEDNFEKAENTVQKRINRLTKKMRDAERDREEAIQYAKQIHQEAENLKTRLSAMDTGYLNESSARVSSELQGAEANLKAAMEIGDTEAAVAAQKQITQLAIQNDRVEQAKMQQARYQQQMQAQPQAQPQAQQPVQPPKVDRKAQDWAQDNDWFGEDEAMTYAAFGIHKKLVEQEGFDPSSDDYYTELDQRMKKEFPHKLGNSGGGKRPAQTVASVNRSSSGRTSGKKVRLSQRQVDMARRLNVPVEEYAKYVKG
tara:strand:- start:1189 stop:2046 length:858 start_codon:yes stop_codon:yes gene_type:complete